jgi:hypothetical protein
MAHMIKVRNLLNPVFLYSLITHYHPTNYYSLACKGRTLSVKLHNYRERTEKLQKRLNSQRTQFTPPDFIKHVFRSVDGCDYVIFQGAIENHFVQYKLADNRLELDFPITSVNYLVSHLKDVRKLLESFNFSFTETQLEPMKYIYRVDNGDDLHCLNADFGNDIDLATQFIVKVFQDLFEDDISRFFIKLG